MKIKRWIKNSMIRKGILIISFISYSANVFSQVSPICYGQTFWANSSFSICDENPWILVFEDEFNDNSLDTCFWNPFTGVPRDLDFIKQKAWHSPNNVEESGGMLKIVSKREDVFNKPIVKSWNPYIVEYENFAYTTGEVWSIYKFGYGKYEARIKIPKGKGFWPAFWLWTGSPKYNENDIFEFWKNNTTTHNITTYYDFNNDGNVLRCVSSYSSFDFSNDFHIFTLEWEKGQTRWYVDGVLKRIDFKYYNIMGQPFVGCTVQKNDAYVLNKVYPNSPMNIIINTAIESGSFAPNASTPFPAYLLVDWVRYYKRRENEDVCVDSTSIEINESYFNSITGINVTIEDFEIKNSQQIAFVATNCITFNKGFHAQKGSLITAKVR